MLSISLKHFANAPESSPKILFENFPQQLIRVMKGYSTKRNETGMNESLSKYVFEHDQYHWPASE